MSSVATMNISDDEIKAIGELLCDLKRPLKERFRALFSLKNIGGPVSIDCISKAFSDTSALLKHECAYCLGQMQDPLAIPLLVKILEDINQEPMVRHEAGEALGAIGRSDVMDILVKYSNDSVIEVAETCQLAVKRLEWLNNDANTKQKLTDNPYSSVDPAPPAPSTDINVLKDLLVDNNATLFERYRAMFTLRNIGTEESVVALSQGLFCGSSLFRHEVAFVLGQLQSSASVPYLVTALADVSQNEMVRHECAEALGAIGDTDVQEELKKYLLEQVPRVVRESCEVALDMCEYETSNEFQYANGLEKIST